MLFYRRVFQKQFLPFDLNGLENVDLKVHGRKTSK